MVSTNFTKPSQVSTNFRGTPAIIQYLLLQSTTLGANEKILTQNGEKIIIEHGDIKSNNFVKGTVPSTNYS